MYRFLKNFSFFFFFLFIVGCQLNDTLIKIKENIKISSNDQDTIIVTKEKKNKAENIKKLELKNKSKDNKGIQKKKEVDENTVSLVQPKIKREKILEIKERKIISKEIGLLFPLSGKDAQLGQNLINSIRFYLNSSSTEIKFKVLDTKSSAEETLNALKKGLSLDIDIFIGPIFSHEALYIKEFAKQNDALIFSLSTDKNAISKNIIITGLSLEDEINCIVEYVTFSGQKKVGVVINDNKYGDLLKEILENLNLVYPDLEISYLTVDESTTIDDEIRKFSFYEQRSKNLNLEINRINSLDFDDEEKSFLIDELQKKETFGRVPYDIVIIGESGSKLIEILALFAFYDIDTSNTNFFGTSVWEGVEKFRENVLDKAFYATSLENDKSLYNKNFSLIFSSKPNNLNYIVSDLLGFLESSLNNEQEFEINGEIYRGMFGTSKINKLGYVQRNIDINEIDNDKVKKIHSCPVPSKI